MAGLITRYLGSKAESRYDIPVFDGAQTLLSPFLGSGAHAQRAIAQGTLKNLIAAESDPSVRDVWVAYRTGIMPKVEGEIRYLKGVCLDQLKDYGRPGVRVFWDWMKRLDYDCTVNPVTKVPLPQRAALSIFLRQWSAAGGVMRVSKVKCPGRLNISPYWDGVIKKLHRWDYVPPEPWQGGLSLHSDYRLAIEAYGASGLDDGVAVIDPPYFVNPVLTYRTKGHMDPAYRWHRPSHPETFSMMVDSCAMAAALLAQGRLKAIVATNYTHPLFRMHMEHLAAWSGAKLRVYPGGDCSKVMQKGKRRVKRREDIWVLERREQSVE